MLVERNNMFHSLKVAILVFVHHRGWCSTLHLKEKPKDWHTICPLVDKIMLLLFPPIIVYNELDFEKAAKGKPGLVVFESDKI